MLVKLKRYASITTNRVSRKERQMLKVSERIRSEEERIQGYLKEIDGLQIYYHTLRLSGSTDLNGIFDLRASQAGLKRKIAEIEISLELSRVEKKNFEQEYERLTVERKQLLHKAEKISSQLHILTIKRNSRRENQQENESTELLGWVR